MAGSLIKIAETTVSSGVSSVSLVGIDSTYDVYKVVFSGVELETDDATVLIRVTTSGSAFTGANYYRAHKVLRTVTTFANVSSINQTSWSYNNLGTGTSEFGNATMYLFNFNNASEYSFYTLESAELTAYPELQGIAGGGLNAVTQACDGLQFLVSSGNIDSGNFALYGLKKD
jgi:hypothetical protein